MIRLIFAVWLLCLGIGAAYADVVYSNPNDSAAQWRNSQWQLQESERRQAQSLEQVNRNQQQEFQAQQSNQLNQRSYNTSNVNFGYVPQVIEKKDDGYYAAYVAAAMVNNNREPEIEPVAIYNHDGMGISKTYLRGETLNLPLGTLSLYVVGESKYGSVKPVIATYNCETHESTVEGKTTVLDDISAPYAVMFGQACRKSYEALVKAQASK